MMQHNGDWAYGPLMKPLHLQYYDLSVVATFPPKKITSSAEFGFYQDFSCNRLTLQLICM